MSSIVLVLHLNNDLRVVQLLQLRRKREPESWSTTADERGQRLQHLARFPVAIRMMMTILIDDLANDLFRLNRSLTCCRQWRISRQPNVDIRKVRKILREKLRLQL